MMGRRGVGMRPRLVGKKVTTGEFTTQSSTSTGINESAGEDAHAAGQVEKIIRDGQVVILRNGETYDLMGQRM